MTQQAELPPNHDALVEYIVLKTMTMTDRLVLRDYCVERHQMQNMLLEKLDKRMGTWDSRLWGFLVVAFLQALSGIGFLLVLLFKVARP